MGLRRTALLLASLATALVSCQAEPILLVVDIRSDLVPGQEFVAVEVDAPGCGGERRREVSADAPVLDGVRAAEYELDGDTLCDLTITLRGDIDQAVLRRTIRVDVRESITVTAVMTRDCRGVECPAPDGDSLLSACVAGRCEDPTCTPETPDACLSPECEADADCPETADCATRRCVEGACLAVPESSCEAPRSCHPERGCIDAAEWLALECASAETCCRWPGRILPQAIEAPVVDQPLLLRWPAEPEMVRAVEATGTPLRVTDVDGAPLPAEWEPSDPDGEALVLWARFPDVSADAETPFWIAWGPGCGTGEAPAAEAVWAGDQVEVWHLSEEGTGIPGEYVDSAGSGTTGQAGEGDPTGAPEREPFLGWAQRFDGQDDFIVLDGGALPREAGTLSHWMRTEQTEARVAYYESSSVDGELDGFGTGADAMEVMTGVSESVLGGVLFFYWDEAPEHGAIAVSRDGDRRGEWVHVAITWEMPGEAVVYIDGEEHQRKTVEAGAIGNYETVFRALGRPVLTSFGGNPRLWDGGLDEVRIADRALPPERIRFDYQNQSDPEAMVSVDELQVSPAMQ